MLKPAIIAASIITVLSSCSSSDEEVTINPRVSAWNAFTPVDGSAMPAASDHVYLGSVTTPDPVEAPVYTTSYQEPAPSTRKASQPIMPGRGTALRASY